jgi:hypothetical protein
MSQSDYKVADRGRWSVPLRSALTDLERLIVARPDLESPARTLARVLEAAFGITAAGLVCVLEDGSSDPSLLMEQVSEVWANDQPAFACIMPCPRGATVIGLALSICKALRAEHSANVDRCHSFIERAPECLLDLIAAFLRVPADRMAEAIGEHKGKFEPSLATSVLRFSLLPVLAGRYGAVCARLREDSWPHGQCPVCGSGLAFGE